MAEDSTPSADRPRNYDGGYMALGREGERIVLRWLWQHPTVVGVTDVRELRVTREADIDCFVKTRDGRITLAEIKTDQHLGVTGNVLFEILRINHTAPPEHAVTLGWAARSPARMLFYYAPSMAAIYACQFNEFRKTVQDWTRVVRAGAKISFVSTDNIKSTINLLVPWHIVSGIFQIQQLAPKSDDERKERVQRKMRERVEKTLNINHETMPLVAQILDETRAIFGEQCRVVYAQENGQTIGKLQEGVILTAEGAGEIAKVPEKTSQSSQQSELDL
jgi:hypothetical protein